MFRSVCGKLNRLEMRVRQNMVNKQFKSEFGFIQLQDNIYIIGVQGDNEPFSLKYFKDVV